MIGVLNGTYDIGIGEIQEVRSQLEAKKVRLLAVLTDKRLPEFPDLPTAQEQGVDLVVTKFRGLAGPKNLPPAVLKAWATASRRCSPIRRIARNTRARAWCRRSCGRGGRALYARNSPASWRRRCASSVSRSSLRARPRLRRARPRARRRLLGRGAPRCPGACFPTRSAPTACPRGSLSGAAFASRRLIARCSGPQCIRGRADRSPPRPRHRGTRLRLCALAPARRLFRRASRCSPARAALYYGAPRRPMPSPCSRSAPRRCCGSIVRPGARSSPLP